MAVIYRYLDLLILEQHIAIAKVSIVSMFKPQILSRLLEATLLAAVDHWKQFVDLTVGWPGSVADGVSQVF